MRLVLRLASLVAILSAVPVALIAVPTGPCPDRPGRCWFVSYPRLGVLVLLVILGLLLWAFTQVGERRKQP